MKYLFNKGRHTQRSNVGTSNLSFRDKWIEMRLLDIPKGWRILDAGAGEQPYRKFCAHLNYVSQDFAAYDGGSDGLHVADWEYGKLDIISDVIEIPEGNQTFDAILCTEVIEHIPDPVKVFPEFSRLLKSGGVLILTSPFCSLTHFAPYHFCTGFSRFFYEKHLSENGFEILELESNGNYFEFLAQELRRVNSIALRYTQGELTKEELRARNTLLYALERVSNRDTGSQELLCYGFHVLARKR